MEFLKRLEEMITRNRKSRWNIIRGKMCIRDRCREWVLTDNNNIHQIVSHQTIFNAIDTIQLYKAIHAQSVHQITSNNMTANECIITTYNIQIR